MLSKYIEIEIVKCKSSRQVSTGMRIKVAVEWGHVFWIYAIF